jgi:hypothetical protein
MKKTVVAIIAVWAITLTSCNITKRNNEKKLHIGATTKTCIAGEMETRCMQVKWSKDQKEWENFYGNIDGFAYQEGKEYELIVKEEKINNPPADATTKRYKLIKIVSQNSINKYLGIIGKSFSLQTNQNTDSTLGGVPFLKFEDDKFVSVKNGDIVEKREYLMENDKLMIAKSIHANEEIFTIIDAFTIKDKNNNNWKNNPLLTELNYAVAKNYFVKNTVKQLHAQKIETQNQFNELVGTATSMGSEGKPTPIDFSKEDVVAIVFPPTNSITSVAVVSVKKDNAGNLIIAYKTVIGQKQSYTSKPSLVVIIDKTESSDIILNEVK